MIYNALTLEPGIQKPGDNGSRIQYILQNNWFKYVTRQGHITLNIWFKKELKISSKLTTSLVGNYFCFQIAAKLITSCKKNKAIIRNVCVSGLLSYGQHVMIFATIY